RCDICHVTEQVRSSVEISGLSVPGVPVGYFSAAVVPPAVACGASLAPAAEQPSLAGADFSSGSGLVAVKARNSVSISGETEVKWIEKSLPSRDAAPSTLPYSVPGISSPLLPMRRILRLLKETTGVSSRTSAALRETLVRAPFDIS